MGKRETVNLVLEQGVSDRPGYSLYFSKESNLVFYILEGKENEVFRSRFMEDLKELPLGIRIKTRRTQLGLTQTDLARRAKLSQANIAIIEAGKSNPNYEAILRLKDSLEVDEKFFF